MVSFGRKSLSKREIYVLRDGKLILKSKDGVLTKEYSSYQPKTTKVGPVFKDDLPGGVNGMLSHADGKRYDSKSRYEQALKAKGCRIVGNDWNNATYKTPLERGVRGDFNVRPQLRDAVNKVMG